MLFHLNVAAMRLAFSVLVAMSTAAGRDAWRPPPYFDYDCDRRKGAPGVLADWDAVYAWVRKSVVERPKDPDFAFPLDFLNMLGEETGGGLVPQGFDASTFATKVEEECPLGVLYLRVLSFYDAVSRNLLGGDLEPYANRVQDSLQRFPMYAIALSRWPVYHALDFFAAAHTEHAEDRCEGIDGVLDWGSLRLQAVVWASQKRGYTNSEDLHALETTLAKSFFTILSDRSNHQRALEECPFGFYFLVANQVVAAANKDTQYLPSFNKILDEAMSDMAFVRFSASGWPIYPVLDIFSDLNKGIWFFEGDRKYLRGYSDWNLRSDELSPMLPSSLDFLSPAWRKAAGYFTDSLALLPPDGFKQSVHRALALRESKDGPVRPILRGLVDVAIAIADAGLGAGNARAADDSGDASILAGASDEVITKRLVYVVLLYGAAWADILSRLAGRFRQLGIEWPLLAIAIGSEAASACRALAERRDGHPSGATRSRVLCWTPDSQSQVHRFTAIHVLLHLGIDVIYMDMDTFMLRDPTPRILSQAVGYDALFAGHADADCINIGVFFLRSNSRTAVWFSQFVAWYHDHPFEVDQRGLHVFLRLPAEKLRIAYPPEDLVEVRAGRLDDVNEVVIGDVGWHGDISRLLIFHWCHRPIDEKEQEIRAAYDAADVAEAHGLALVVAITASLRASPGSRWAKVLELRSIFEAYRTPSPPERTPCW